jgi:hypothetical protein
VIIKVLKTGNGPAGKPVPPQADQRGAADFTPENGLVQSIVAHRQISSRRGKTILSASFRRSGRGHRLADGVFMTDAY